MMPQSFLFSYCSTVGFYQRLWTWEPLLPPHFFSAYKHSLKSSPILRILFVSQQKYVDLYFAVTHFLLLMSWPGWPQSPAGLEHWRQPWLCHHHQALPSPTQAACPCAQPHFHPHATLSSRAAQWNGAHSTTPTSHQPPPLGDKDVPFPSHSGTGSCQNSPWLKPRRAPYQVANTAGLCSPQPHYPLSPHVFNKPHEQHLTTNLSQGSLPVQFICLTLRVAFPPAEVFTPLH